MTKSTIIFCDFDGTMFDPDLRLFKAPFYNLRSARIIKRNNALFVMTTGRHSWDRPTMIQYKLTGMRLPDVVIAGAGTYIYWRKKRGYELDEAWDGALHMSWSKAVIKEKLSGFLHEHNLSEIEVPNPYMVFVRLYGMSLEDVQSIWSKLKIALKDEHVKILLTEQLILPNTPSIFNGYALIVPEIAGKDSSSVHVLMQLEKEHGRKFDMLAFGDATVDMPLLTMEKPSHVNEYKSYGLHLTPLARLLVHRSSPVLLEGSAPESIYNVLSEFFRSPRNSPFRSLVSPFEALIDKTVYPTMSPNEITQKGLDEVNKGLEKGGISGFYRVLKGHLLDSVDGIRARRHPELKTEDGQLVDVYADRTKEYRELVRRGRYEAALSCILPSIARAQAEALGKTVTELDPSGGSALTRTRRLLTSLLFSTLGFYDASKKIDDRIAAANLATFHRRRATAADFSWTISHLKTYDRTPLERLLLLVELAQKQSIELAKTEKVKNSELEEYLSIDTKKLRTQLKIHASKIG